MKKNILSKGQTLVTLLFFMVIAIIITTAAAIIVAFNAQGTSSFEGGTDAYYAAESGAENALMRFIRDHSYLGETINLNDNITVYSTVSAGLNNSYTIIATGSSSQAIRTVQISTVYNDNVVTVSSWKEIQ